MIVLEQVTRSFSNGRGIFDVSLQVRKGEVFGFIGPNGAGKSTTIRHLMGFMKADSGKATICGLDCWNDATTVKRSVGYLPGEIAFIEGMTGTSFLMMMDGMRAIGDTRRKSELIERFEFNPDTPIRKMSKGMKQKVGIVAAFMHDPQVYILDEPTSGLDPLMQQRFVELVLEEKQRGKTIFMSSHMFREMEKTCDRAAMIKDGRIVIENDMKTFQREKKQRFHVTLRTEEDIKRLLSYPQVKKLTDATCEVCVGHDIKSMIDMLHGLDIVSFHGVEENLEELFLHYYKRGESV
ncbi:ABC transporter ATP-binding protein [Ectobacillus antri]|jgi:ABC-2 type transport system ATP-binding protein|uniref:ABC transporter ATP-binding protein n=1 Tax=Ectobacillus antri TaxID=2486280 RepID=A0ABT6H475_9BACI|nr:ABC transporter ATP-binding protein [Ectobacillus antri]MDG4655443.1 ABC transporter ATP-binding protein [Ectobacillus antri]MDG5753201.1 ABC transporter ATP-binding protein [Ectobacillus antri]